MYMYMYMYMYMGTEGGLVASPDQRPLPQGQHDGHQPVTHPQVGPSPPHHARLTADVLVEGEDVLSHCQVVRKELLPGGQRGRGGGGRERGEGGGREGEREEGKEGREGEKEGGSTFESKDRERYTAHVHCTLLYCTCVYTVYV